jgi:hypothetical protein
LTTVEQSSIISVSGTAYSEEDRHRKVSRRRGSQGIGGGPERTGFS